jgi:hypothetical protein
MSANVKNYSVSKVKQLIDLNGDSTNFDISFRVTSQNNAPFDILVVDQATLDGNPDLKYKSVTNGSISGRIKHDKNVYQNHFMILRAENPCECNVEIRKTDLQPAPVQQAPVQPTTRPTVATTKDGFHWIKIILVLGFIIGIGFALYWFSKKQSVDTHTKKYTQEPSSHGSPSHASHGSPSPPPARNRLLERLQGLNMDI